MLDSFTAFLLERVGEWGLFGVFFLMAVESSFIPFPSEVVMIPAGYLASRGEMNLLAAIVAGTAGSVVGAWFNYVLALKLGRPAIHRLGKRFLISERTMTLVERYFEKHGGVTTFVGRFIPAVRQLISLPAGLARMPFGRFTVLTALGAGIWVTILALLGYFVGEQAATSENVMRNTTLSLLAVAAAIVILYLAGKRYFKKAIEPAAGQPAPPTDEA